MIIDPSHRNWIAISLAVLAVSSVAYLMYADAAPYGPAGGSWPGLCFGIVGSLFMVFAGLLAARKKLPNMRLGPAQFWLKGHIWLGLLSVPMILFHAGFRFGGVLEQSLMWVFFVVVISGVFGLVIQQYIPRVMKVEIPAAAIGEQIEQTCTALRHTADQLVNETCGSLFVEVTASNAKGPSSLSLPHENPYSDVLRGFYLERIRPFLSVTVPRESTLLNEPRAAAIFSRIKDRLPDATVDNSIHKIRETLSRLEAICDERRSLITQEILHRWLHGWLLVHVPLSMTLLVLGIVHVATALYY